MTYNQFLKYLGIPVNKRSAPRKSDEEMLRDLVHLADELGRPPLYADLTGRVGICGKSTYANRFGTWSNALILAGFKPTWRPVSDEELIAELKRFREEMGRSPTTRDRLAFGWATYSVRFGSWNNALTAAGLSLNDNIFGTKTYGKDGVLYDSISESIIADWLFDSRIPYLAHVPYFNKLIADFKVYDTYVEFFGLPNIPEYAAKMRIKQRLCARRGVPLIEIFSADLPNLHEKLGHFIGMGDDAYAA